ncbi:MAG TPA: YigZ family protein [Candidatus Mcinerneyibacteriales bacterium]|jgi:uncharacterized YigZ family protein|nr:YigZ family protein [Candidatus Mcinerneyibacteriales bacterium]HPE19748.1 YigZ family protein [Candidatus Mcinerneyibacteriales bacterium]HPJ69318.1 YigZ family protein [Candidatus Mcinerneyibacteriales bacterium]HPQ89810.1 YigZ family protein [Candidatus Mcinerneyibacteriales bacterium]
MINSMEIQTLSRTSLIEIVVKKSRFIGEAFPCTSEEEALSLLEGVKKREMGATHHCWGYVLGLSGEQARYHDDGEPRGTAGLPILDVIRKKNLTNTFVVITRYFGGVKLGAGGLVRAYTDAAARALDEGGIHLLTAMSYCRLNFPYPVLDPLERLLAEKGLDVDQRLFEDSVTFFLWVPRSAQKELESSMADLSRGELLCEILKEKYR